MHWHSYLLVRARPIFTMPRRQGMTPSDEEDSTPPISSSPITLNHERLETWFEGHEDRKQMILRLKTFLNFWTRSIRTW